MPTYPRYTVQANQAPQEDLHERNPSWCVAFIRFKEPASSYGSLSNLVQTKPLLVVENDCVVFHVSRPKGSFAKMCQLTMKVSNVYYANSVSPGDWMMFWAADYQSDIDRIIQMLYSGDSSGKLINWDSGLKFWGRVTEVGSVDAVMVNGVRTLVQNISCQMFLEMATSIYYTFLAKSLIQPSASTPSGVSAETNGATAAISYDEASTAFVERQVEQFTKGKAMSSFLQEFAETPYHYPDDVVRYLFVMTMGVPRSSNLANADGKVLGELSDAITIPRELASISGIQYTDVNGNKSTPTYLWQLYNLYAGIQHYSNAGNHPWSQMMPDLSNADDVFKRTSYRCKGFVPFFPMQWDNQPIWSILNQYINPVVNEMYTALRINSNNQIRPTLVIREAPFGTGLYNSFSNGQLSQVKTVQDGEDQANNNTVQQIVKSSDPTKTKLTTVAGSGATLQQTNYRAMYYNTPRWIIDESMIKSVNTATNESARINFVQVWGSAEGIEFATGNSQFAESVKFAGFNLGNYVADFADIQRSGLRADIVESRFDVATNNQKGTNAPEWARIRADRYFNGHLKLSGSIQCYGIQVPICEGDNCQVRGIVYQIEGLDFTGRIDSSSGKKTFDTTIQVSNGLLAKNLDAAAPPMYFCHLFSTSPVDNDGPGYSEIQTINGRDPQSGDPANANQEHKQTEGLPTLSSVITSTFGTGSTS